jgi:hypothetical protein
VFNLVWHIEFLIVSGLWASEASWVNASQKEAAFFSNAAFADYLDAQQYSIIVFGCVYCT